MQNFLGRLRRPRGLTNFHSLNQPPKHAYGSELGPSTVQEVGRSRKGILHRNVCKSPFHIQNDAEETYHCLNGYNFAWETLSFMRFIAFDRSRRNLNFRVLFVKNRWELLILWLLEQKCAFLRSWINSFEVQRGFLKKTRDNLMSTRVKVVPLTVTSM